MTNKLLSVNDAVEQAARIFNNTHVFYYDDIQRIIDAVQREERERGAAIAETEGYFDLAKKILEEK